MRILILTLLLQIIPISPSNLTVTISPILGDCLDPKPNPVNLTITTWETYTSFTDHSATYTAIVIPQNAGNAAYCLASGQGSGIEGLADGVLEFCQIPQACFSYMMGGSTPKFTLGTYTYYGGEALPTGTVVVDPNDPWKATCVDCNVRIHICNSDSSNCIE